MAARSKKDAQNNGNGTDILGLADEASHGTKRLQTELLTGLRFALPPSPACARLAAVFEVLAARQTAAARESSTLAIPRDALLPKLMSGELRVPEAERIAEAAT